MPSRESELTFGWPYRAWYIDREEDCLVFSQRDERRAPFGELIHSAYARDKLFQQARES